MNDRISRVLFDFDGTLFDTQGISAEVESSLLVPYGIDLDPDTITERYAGVRTEEFFRDLLGDALLAENLVIRKWELLMSRVAEAKPLGDLDALFSSLAGEGIGISIGTASPKAWATSILERQGLLSFFDTDDIVGGDMVRNGKPDPETWILAARGIAPSECIVVEDGIAGIEGALAAGMSPFLLLPRKYPGVTSLVSVADIPGIVLPKRDS
ncbi:MAG: HAD family phosphatase [Candidatus Moranbacteria bacterium]|nr:HAD family phosphatase [Candidatus Moranbacteria bacterium]